MMDCHPYRYDRGDHCHPPATWDTHRHRSHRLPTPDEPRSCRQSYDDEPSFEHVRRGRHVNDVFHRSADNQDSRLRTDPQRGMPHLDPRHSQFHGHARHPDDDMGRPSLPPLRTILADSMISSPPQTPGSPVQSLQPSPREPVYPTTTTYKPPSLYPNKKPRSDLYEPSSAYTTHPPFASPPPPAAAAATVRPLQPTFDRLHRPHSYSTASSPRHLTYRVRDARDTTPPSAVYSINTAAAESSARYRTPDATPVDTHPPATAAVCRPPQLDSTRLRYGGASGAPTTDAHRVHDADLRERAAALPASTTACASTAHTAGYTNTPPTYFLSTHYNSYPHGKARKRSNLPKHSTEIMKTWFDQNISNPYPSEEQKTTFAQNTGISMTQVSNWFINHRRRCPELRERRTSYRGREAEMEARGVTV